MRVGVTFTDNRQRLADEWWSVEMAAATARRVSDMMAELGQRPLVWSGGPWRSRLSVGAKISYPVSVAATTDHKQEHALYILVCVSGYPELRVFTM